MEVYVNDSVRVTTWTSSGTTLNFESIDLLGSSGREITVTGVLADEEWLSITEVCASPYVDEVIGSRPCLPMLNGKRIQVELSACDIRTLRFGVLFFIICDVGVQVQIGL